MNSSHEKEQLELHLWLRAKCDKLDLEIKSLQGGHSSNRDNGRWIAEAQGMLDVCTLLKDTLINNETIEEVKSAIDGKRLSNVEKEYIAYYRNRANKFIGEVTNKL